MSEEISTIEAVRARMVDRVLVVMAILMVPGVALSWYRVSLIGVQPVLILHATFVIVLGVAAVFRHRFSFKIKATMMLVIWFVLGTIGLVSFGQVGLSGSLFIIFIIMTTAFLGKRQGWLAVGASGVVSVIVAISVSAGWLKFEFDIQAYALSPITWTLYVVVLVFFSAIILAVLTSIQDALTDSISTLQQKVDELAAARDQAEVANRSKSTFMSNISHEFRTPLNAIIGFASIMKRKAEDPRMQKNLETIETSGRALTTLVSSILDLSRIESEDIELNLSTVDLRTTLQSTITRHEREAGAKGIELSLEIDENIPAQIRADEGRLHQVLHHLVGNAIKFTKQGTVTLGVDRVDQRDLVADLSIWVADTGIGIPEHEREAIFKPFTQMDGQSIDDYGGTGIGLALARQLVEAMDGEIRVESTVGEGSRFEVVLKDVEVLPASDTKEGISETPPVVLTDEIRARLPALVKLLDGDLLVAWTELLGGFAMTDIEAFSVQIQDLGKEYEYPPLTAWGQQVQAQVNDVELEALPKTLEQFPDLIEEIRKLI